MKTSQKSVWVVLVALGVAAVSGCAFDPEQFDPQCDDNDGCAGTGGTAGMGGSGGTGGQAPQACVPHSKAPCVCASGMPGDKWCYEDGSGYGQCICNTPSGTYCRDADCDTYGDPASCLQTSTPPAGYVQNANDCNDANAGINPGMSEIPCNGVDENCDGSDYCPQTGGSGGGTGGTGGGTDACNNACGPGTHCQNGACVPDNTGGTGGTAGTGGSTGGGTDCGSFDCGNDPCTEWGPQHCACLLWKAPKKVVEVQFKVNSENSHATLFGGIVRGNAGDDNKVTENEWCSYSTFLPNGNIQGAGTKTVQLVMPVGDFAFFWNVWETTTSNTNKYACTNHNNSGDQWFDSDEYATIAGHKEDTVLEQYENGVNNGNNCFSRSGTDY